MLVINVLDTSMCSINRYLLSTYYLLTTTLYSDLIIANLSWIFQLCMRGKRGHETQSLCPPKHCYAFYKEPSSNLEDVLLFLKLLLKQPFTFNMQQERQILKVNK